MRFLKYSVAFLIGFFIAKYQYSNPAKKTQKEEIQIVVNSIKEIQKLVVVKSTFTEIYNYKDSKKYFYDYLSFDKKAIVTVQASVEVGYNLSDLEIKIDSIGKKINILKIPKEEVVIATDIKYFDLEQSTFNSFSAAELTKINEKCITKIKASVAATQLKTKAKNRLFTELSKIYQLSAKYRWQVVNNTDLELLGTLKN